MLEALSPQNACLSVEWDRENLYLLPAPWRVCVSVTQDFVIKDWLIVSGPSRWKDIFPSGGLEVYMPISSQGPQVCDPVRTIMVPEAGDSP